MPKLQTPAESGAAASEAAEPKPRREQGISTGTAFCGVLIVASVAAGCVVVMTKRRGPSMRGQLSDLNRWAYRRIYDLSGRGPDRYDPHMASRLSFARIRAKRERAKKGKRSGGKGRGGVNARPLGACYSLTKTYCPAHAPAPPNRSCVTAQQDHADAKRAESICGTRLPRRNPCWEEHGVVRACEEERHGRYRCSTHDSERAHEQCHSKHAHAREHRSKHAHARQQRSKRAHVTALSGQGVCVLATRNWTTHARRPPRRRCCYC